MGHYVRRPGKPVNARRVTAKNMAEVAKWSGGTYREDWPSIYFGGEIEAFIGHWVLTNGGRPWALTDDHFREQYGPVQPPERDLIKELYGYVTQLRGDAARLRRGAAAEAFPVDVIAGQIQRILDKHTEAAG